MATEAAHLLSPRGSGRNASFDALSSGPVFGFRASRMVRVPAVSKDWSEEEPRRSLRWSELFLDLVCGTVLSHLGQLLRGNDQEHLSWEVFSRLFMAVWLMWLVRRWPRAAGVQAGWDGS